MLPWPRLWTFKRKGARDLGSASFANHAVVGSWRIPSESLGWWLYSAELTVLSALRRERELRRLQGKHFSRVPHVLTFTILPREWNWLKTADRDTHLLLAVAPDEFPDMAPDED